MIRKLTAREKVLLSILGVLLVGVLYYLLFYVPMTNRTKDLQSEIADLESQIATSQARGQKMQHMEAELKTIFEKNPNPPALARYDNSNALMSQLNAILAAASSYNLTFAAVDTSTPVISRGINLTFTAESYFTARSILDQIQNGKYRCLIRDLSVTIGGGRMIDGTGGTSHTVFVTANLTYYEYVE